MLKNLLLRPQKTIPQLIAQEPRQWLVPLTGYFCVSFAEGYDRVVMKYASLPGVVLIAIVAISVLLIGVWAWAGIFGGVLHLSSRLFKGKP
jgi:hypothetical protein